MGLSSHDRKVLAAIEHDLSGQDPKLADLFAAARPGGRRGRSYQCPCGPSAGWSASCSP